VRWHRIGRRGAAIVIAAPLQGQQWRRGERERDEWLNRDAAQGGSFREGRKSMRELLLEEKRAARGGGAATGATRHLPAITSHSYCRENSSRASARS
jgi:hypothetical protein